jgi:hypothetical protein
MIAENVRQFNLFQKQRIFSHIEIHPMNLLGWVSAVIPFPQHSQAPRNIFAFA